MKNIQLLLLTLALFALNPAPAQTRGIALEANASSPTTPYVNGVYRALIIGNNQYRDPHGRWPELKTAVSDARAVSRLLQDNYGFSDVDIVEDATRRDILKALDRLSAKALPNDSILIYYAGHGFLEADTNQGFWVPVDAEGTDNSTFLRNSTIRDELTTISSRAKHTLLISDSCFSGTLLRSATRSISPSETTESYFEKVSVKKSVQIISAGGVEYVDDNYQASGHSPFTYFLLNELKNNDRPLLTVSELSGNVSRAVASNVNQVPESGVLHGAGDELGEFIFIKLNIQVEGVNPEDVKVEVNINSTSGNVVIDKEVSTEAVTDDSSIFVPLPTL